VFAFEILDEEVEETLIEISIPKVGITSTSKNENENVALAGDLLVEALRDSSSSRFVENV